MPFDPNLPVQGSPNSSAVMRAQLNGLKALIDAVSGVTSAQVDAVNTLPAGSPASVAVSVSGSVLHLSFDLPQGNDGPPGANGSDGAQGPPGNDGAPFTNFMVDGVSTLNPGGNATVQANYDGSAVRLSFGIPRGYQGDAGPPGSNGSDGAPGPQGPPFANALVDGVNTLNPGDAAYVNTSFDGSNVRFTFGIPRGPNGSDGAPGPPFANAVVDGVTTLNPGDAATVNTSFDGSNVRFTFGIPRGFQGDAGPPGSNGNDGPPGPQGPPFANAMVDGVTTLNPWDSAYVNTSFDGYHVRFTFGIPRGQNGSDGSPGPQGPPGEVTQMQLNSAINGTSNNSNAVSLLGMTVSDPPTVGEVQAIADKLDELINALRR
jgi:hypothetical protein